jgi:hypothetical protein
LTVGDLYGVVIRFRSIQMRNSIIFMFWMTFSKN